MNTTRQQIDKLMTAAVVALDMGRLHEVYEDMTEARESNQISAHDKRIFELMFDAAAETIEERAA